MKNEGPYILEWVAFHRAIGFDALLVYTNDCEDGSDRMLIRLEELGLVKHEANEVLRRGPHKSALKYAFVHPLTLATDWIYIADCDEFLNVKIGDGSVRALTETAGDADCIPVTWRLFGNDCAIEFEDAPIIETMTDAELPLAAGGGGDRFVKSLFRRSDAVERFGLHGPRIRQDAEPGYRFAMPDGRRLGPKDNRTRIPSEFGYEAAQVNHYAVRSLDGYLVKRDRGRANHVNHVLGVEYWRRMCLGGERDRSILRHAPALRAAVAKLKEDRVLASLHDAAVAWHREKIREMRERPEIVDLRAELVALSEGRAPEPAAAPASPPPPSQDVFPRIRTLCAELRGLLDRVEPVQAASNAHGRLDEIERGLFGATNR